MAVQDRFRRGGLRRGGLRLALPVSVSGCVEPPEPPFLLVSPPPGTGAALWGQIKHSHMTQSTEACDIMYITTYREYRAM